MSSSPTRKTTATVGNALGFPEPSRRARFRAVLDRSGTGAMRLDLPLSRGASGVAPSDWTHRIVFERPYKDLEVFLVNEQNPAVQLECPARPTRSISGGGVAELSSPLAVR